MSLFACAYGLAPILAFATGFFYFVPAADLDYASQVVLQQAQVHDATLANLGMMVLFPYVGAVLGIAAFVRLSRRIKHNGYAS